MVQPAAPATKRSFIISCVIQLVCAVAILYRAGGAHGALLNFCFGFANAAHMLTFSSAADVVPPQS